MRELIYAFLLTIVLPATFARAENRISLAGEIEIPLPRGWQLGSDSSEYPFQLVHSERTAEMLIFKSEIEPDDVLHDKDDLQQSVEWVVEDVILTLPGAKLLTSTGYIDSSRTGFVIEFLSGDSVQEVTLQHRFNGVIYRHPDGRQLLFTLWAKASSDMYSNVAEDLKLIQEGFAYTGPQLPQVFAPRGYTTWYMLLGGLLVMIILWRLRPRSKSRPSSVPNGGGGLWTCECGRMNYHQIQDCRRCGQPRETGDASVVKAETNNAEK